MSIRHAISSVALASALGWVVPAQAQSPEEFRALQADMEAMRQQMQSMQERIESLQGELAQTRRDSEQAQSTAAEAVNTAQKATETAARTAQGVPKVAWKGAPELSADGGWSFKPRGRLNFDAGIVDAPEAIDDEGLGFASEVRRARLGVEGTVPGGFGYKFEVDFADNETEVVDAVLTYADDGLGATVGQHNAFQSLEELTSSRFTSFMERAAFTDAFGFERRLGLSASYVTGPVLLQGGVFTDNISDLTNDENNAISADVRAVFMPKLGAVQLHLGGSAHWRDLNDAASSVRYRQRPFVHFTDTRFIDTGPIAATGERAFGLEAAAISGRLHVSGEAYWQTVRRPGLADPTFFGGYAEVGYFLTRGDTRGYKAGQFDRVKPARGIDQGGIGAIQVNLRYDYLDLVDADIVGGKQNLFAGSLIWTPTAYTRLMANYARIDYDLARIAAGLDRDYTVDAFAMRAQIDF